MKQKRNGNTKRTVGSGRRARDLTEQFQNIGECNLPKESIIRYTKQIQRHFRLLETCQPINDTQVHNSCLVALMPIKNQAKTRISDSNFTHERTQWRTPTRIRVSKDMHPLIISKGFDHNAYHQSVETSMPSATSSLLTRKQGKEKVIGVQKLTVLKSTSLRILQIESRRSSSLGFSVSPLGFCFTFRIFFPEFKQNKIKFRKLTHTKGL